MRKRSNQCSKRPSEITSKNLQWTNLSKYVVGTSRLDGQTIPDNFWSPTLIRKKMLSFWSLDYFSECVNGGVGDKSQTGIKLINFDRRHLKLRWHIKMETCNHVDVPAGRWTQGIQHSARKSLFSRPLFTNVTRFLAAAVTKGKKRENPGFEIVCHRLCIHRNIHFLNTFGAAIPCISARKGSKTWYFRCFETLSRLNRIESFWNHWFYVSFI